MFTLIGLAVALVLITIAPVTTEVSHTETTSYNWYFKPREDGLQPQCADNANFLDQYNVYYLGNPAEKTIYLTFDVGYENGNTEQILNILKEKKAPAAFFVTGHYMDTNPDLIKRMASEGHLVCNHTVHHKDLSAMSSPEEFSEEVLGLAQKYKEITDQEMPKFLRPPEGKYSEKSLQMTDELGYTMVFWSFAYKDWINDQQPDPTASIQKIISRTHPGAIVLLHSNSATNAQILGGVIDQWREDGYTLKGLNEFTKGSASGSAASPSPSPAISASQAAA